MSISGPCKVRARCIENANAPRFGLSDSGNEQIALAFTLLDEEGVDTGETIDWVGTFASEKSNEITIKALRNCGWKTDDIANLNGINDNEVELDIQFDEYNGERRLKVKWVNKPGGNRIKFKNELDERGKKALAARLRGTIAANKASGGASAAGNGRGAKVDTSDIPF